MSAGRPLSPAWLLWTAAVYAVTLVALAPSALLDTALVHWTRGQVRLADARGTLWSGSAVLQAARSAVLPAQSIGGIRWRLSSLQALRGMLEFELAQQPAGRPFTLRAGLAGLETGDALVELPARVLGLLQPRLSALEPGGQLRVQVREFTLRNGDAAGAVDVLWHRARSGLSAVSPLGDYRMRLETQGGRVAVKLDTVNGPLELDGNGLRQPGTSFEFRGQARVPASLQRQLEPLLRLIAVDRGGGRFDLELR